MILLAGLGNPGDKYKDNRHNIGFWVVDAIQETYGFPAYRSKFHGAFSEGKIDGVKVGLIKPQTYMNESGISVKAAAKFYKIDTNRIYMFHDELDLSPGKMRTKKGGGTAGHNGLKSVQAHLGTPDFRRVRIGIGHPGDKTKVHGYVLKDFSKQERPVFEDLAQACAKHIGLLLSGDEPGFMSKVAINVTGKED